MRRLTDARETAGEKVSVIGFKGAQAGIEQLALGDDDDVETRGDFVATENLSNQTFGPVSLNGAPELPSRRDAEPSDAERIGEEEQRRVTAVDLETPIVDLLELRAATDPFGRAKSHRRRAGPRGLLAADGQPFTAFRAAALQHEASILRAHAHQKPMRPLPVARIGLKRADSLGHGFPSE